MYWKFTNGLGVYAGFSAVRFRFQDVEDPSNKCVEWLGLFFPLHGGQKFSNCLKQGFSRGLQRSSVRDIRDWIAMTFYIIRKCMAVGTLHVDARYCIEHTPDRIKLLQSDYEAVEHVYGAMDAASESSSVYAPGYDSIPRN